jgi:hypothetical protein
MQNAENDNDTLGRALGWVSLALGGGALAAPRAIAGLIGVENDGGLIPLVGAREIVAGIALLTQRNKAPWIWARVWGDIMDLTLLEAALRGERTRKDRTAIALAVIAAITAVDVFAAQRTAGDRSPNRAERSAGERRYDGEGVALDEFTVVESAPTV